MFLAKLKLHQSFLPEILCFFCPFKSTFDFYFRSLLKIEARSEWRNLLAFSLKKIWHYNFTIFFRPSFFSPIYLCSLLNKKKNTLLRSSHDKKLIISLCFLRKTRNQKIKICRLKKEIRRKFEKNRTHNFWKI